MTDSPLRYTVRYRAEEANRVRRQGNWRERLTRVWRAVGRDNISIMAAGIAYYAMLSIFPGMSALVLTYGLVADPQAISYHVGALAGVLPGETLKLLTDQLNTLVSAPTEKLGIGLLVSVLIALWSATSGTSAMMNALTIAYEGKEERGLLHFYGLSIALTVAGAVFVLIALVLIAGVPNAVTKLPLSPAWQQAVALIRFPMLAVLAYLGLGALYRLAPHRKAPDWDFARAGTMLASFLWLAGSAAFSFYAAHFGSYDKTYGSLGAVVLLLVWLYVSAYIVLVGAELNGEILRDDTAVEGGG
ncbi:MAG TPA: YihY/virulence factor BrkB family protein [Stellaceae bacterium]|jgi:membrane protein|nr:YihY/virulence factor BrkB family protein [Stellaceae bacterium]